MPLRLVHSVPGATRAAPSEWRLTSRDLMALHHWMGLADEHGYRRVVIEPGKDGGEPEDGGFALLFAHNERGAMWGVARRGEQVTVWQCGTGVDLGVFDSMQHALASLPSPKGWPARIRESIQTRCAAFP